MRKERWNKANEEGQTEWRWGCEYGHRKWKPSKLLHIWQWIQCLSGVCRCWCSSKGQGSGKPRRNNWTPEHLCKGTTNLLYDHPILFVHESITPLYNWIWQYCCCSLVMQKRRERINERLKILQNLVPNGTKVDISTMLEEAVHYVKFLQLQIRVRICRVWFSWHHP